MGEHCSFKWKQTLISCFKLGFFFFFSSPRKKQMEPTSLVAQMVKDPPEMLETWVQSLGWEDPLEEGMAAHCSSLT